MKTIILLSLIILASPCFSQDQSLSFPKTDTVSLTDSIPKLTFHNKPKGKVVLQKSADLDEITEFVGKHKSDPEKVRIDGFRVQIYFNENKSIALGQKANFMSQFAEHKAYLDYLAPNYRVRVGNFRTKLEAEKLKQELLSNYPTCIIIKDHIELPVLKTSIDLNNPSGE